MILEIEKIVFEGWGLSHDEYGTIVFVKNVLPGEKVNVSPYKVTKNYIKANLVEIITPSKDRIKPVCPYANICGGCDFAYAKYDYQIKIKQQIVDEIFANIKKNEPSKSPKILNYRCKTQFPVSQTKNSKRMLIGYYKPNTHDIVNIKYCPIQPDIIDKIAEFFRNEWKLGCYNERTKRGLLRHVNSRISNSNGDIILTIVLNKEKIGNEEIIFAKKIMQNFFQIKGVFANFNTENTNKITGKNTVLIAGESYITEHLGKYRYKVGSNSFFQVNPSCAEILFANAKKLIKNRGDLLDLYGGCGTIGIFMKDCANKITLVEQNNEAIMLAEENYKLNNIKNYEIIENDANKSIYEFIKQKRYFENVVIDPPRKGSDEKTLNAISQMTRSVIYISCNPMTLKRDSAILIKNGFKFKTVQMADMFPNTHHIELLAHFKKD